MTRSQQKEAFVASTLAANWSMEPLAGDASRRSYFRLTAQDGRRRILMDAPPESGEDIRPFLAIARHLSSIGLSVPQMDAIDETAGFILMEDLGDGLVSRIAQNNPDQEADLYGQAAEALGVLHAHPPPTHVPQYGPSEMAELAGLAEIWFASTLAKPVLPAIVRATLDRLALRYDVLALRDYHAENILWLPQRKGVRRVGILDFQDAAIGHCAYDICSLLKDARRHVNKATQAHARAVFRDTSPQKTENFDGAFAALSAQRNLRILGVFSRLAIRDGKQQYIDYIPRVWDNLMDDLRRPELAELCRAVTDCLPTPTDSHMATLRNRCAQIHNPS